MKPILRCSDGALQRREGVCHMWRLVEFACQPCWPAAVHDRQGVEQI